MSYANDAANFFFLQTKGFATDNIEGLTAAKKWLCEATGDELMLGEPNGDPFDIAIGEMRRPMLIDFVNEEIRKLSQSKKAQK